MDVEIFSWVIFLYTIWVWNSQLLKKNKSTVSRKINQQCLENCTDSMDRLGILYYIRYDVIEILTA